MASAAPSETILDPTADRSAKSVTTDSLAIGIAFFAALSVIQRLVGFGRSLAFCHLMSDSELGRWSLSFSFLMMAAPMAVLGLPGSFGRYYEYYRQRGQTRAFLRRVLTLTAVLSTSFVMLVLAFPDVISHALLGSPRHADLVRNLAIALALVVALNVTTELATAMRQVRLVSVVQFIHSALFAIVACALLTATSLADQGVVVAYIVGAAAALAIALWGLIGRSKEISADTQPLGRSLWSRLIPFAAWLWVADALFNLFDVIDRLMIVHFANAQVSTDALVGQYHSSRVIPTLLVALASMLACVLLPYLSEDWERGRRKKASATTILAIKSCTLLFLCAGTGVLLTSPILFGMLLQGRYDAGLQVLPGTLLYCIWFSITILVQNHLLCAERAKWTSLALLVGLLVNVGFNAMLLPWFGLSGAVAATAAANAFALITTLLFARSAGLHLDRQTWLIILLPMVLLLGWPIALATLVGLGALMLRFNMVFDAGERSRLAQGWLRCTERLTGRKPDSFA
ncbi:MAG: lipopolysaccharide biosynthesis protein [Pirellulales bacterium]|nr:lipopolysaccharide biosynthesis protein [Pirellulales bacterium]